jgi:hypothetical protein
MVDLLNGVIMAAAEFLSDTTRLTKRNLLFVSLLGMTVKSYGMTVNQIEVGGVKLGLENGGLAFMVSLSMIYLFVSFIVYFSIDIKNTDKTKHQDDSEKKLIAINEGIKERHLEAIGLLVERLGIRYNPFSRIKEFETVCEFIYECCQSKKSYDSLENTITGRLKMSPIEYTRKGDEFLEFVARLRTSVNELRPVEYDKCLEALRIIQTNMTKRSITQRIRLFNINSTYNFRHHIWDFFVPVLFAIVSGIVMYFPIDVRVVGIFLPDMTRPGVHVDNTVPVSFSATVIAGQTR